MSDRSNVFTVNEVSHFSLDEEGRIKILDVALSKAGALAVGHLLHDGYLALAEAVLHGGQVGLVRCLDSLILHFELVEALERLRLLWVELLPIHFSIYLLYYLP